MTETQNEIWQGDALDRKEEAIRLERFLNYESYALIRQQRKQAFVLGLDAPYGEGKSWFLSRFRRHLALNHPVAFVDAWVDDANQEPLVSIMAALEDALKDFMGRRTIREKFDELTRAALPIMGKAAIGAASKAIGRYLGEGFGGQVQDALASAKSDSDGGSPLDAALDSATSSISEIVDSAGKAMLDQYRARQKSRETFKARLQALAASIRTADDPRIDPIYVIVDELDRCRPSYAISLLEEIKHLFDVPGVVFVIALHGDQLCHSIKAVYGAEFDAKDYLRRFFSRTYRLRRLSVKELVVNHFGDIPQFDGRFSWPELWMDMSRVDLSAPELIGELLTGWGVTPRETQSIMDGLRVFLGGWDDAEIPVELPLLLVFLVELIRGEPLACNLERYDGRLKIQVLHGRMIQGANVKTLIETYRSCLRTNVSDVLGMSEANAVGALRRTLVGEFETRQNRGQLDMPISWASYPERISQVGLYMANMIDMRPPIPREYLPPFSD